MVDHLTGWLREKLLFWVVADGLHVRDQQLAFDVFYCACDSVHSRKVCKSFFLWQGQQQFVLVSAVLIYDLII